MHFRIDQILKEKGKTRYWLYMQLGLSYQNFKRIVENETSSIKFENLKALCDILDCTPNDLFEEYTRDKKKHSSAFLEQMTGRATPYRNGSSTRRRATVAC